MSCSYLNLGERLYILHARALRLHMRGNQWKSVEIRVRLHARNRAACASRAHMLNPTVRSAGRLARAQVVQALRR